jgi:hypothetical protein
VERTFERAFYISKDSMINTSLVVVVVVVVDVNAHFNDLFMSDSSLNRKKEKEKFERK